jgi:hypothetical protein
VAAFAIGGKNQREQAMRILSKLSESRAMVYDGSPRTARLHARGPTVHSLPRDLRRLAHRGATVLDLKACQLAIVARVWGCDPLLAFMEAGSPWEQWLRYLSIGPERKPTQKRGLYSLAYGRNEHVLRRYLTTGGEGEPPLTTEQADRLMNHPVIAALLSARERAYQQARAAGGIEDAFGHWHPINKENWTRDVWARVIQSVELMVMREAIEVAASHRDTRILSWLHDGATIWVTEREKWGLRIDQITRAVNRGAHRIGLPTEVEKDDLTEWTGKRRRDHY